MIANFLVVNFSLRRFISIIIIAFAIPVCAEDDTILDTIQVTVQHGSDTNTVVRQQRIELEQANSLRDLFQRMPEVHVGGGLPMAQKVYVRGMTERMLNITVDGAAQLESAYHHTGQIMIEPELLKRVEVEAGTGTAAAGPGALAGALRFTTRSADDFLSKGERFGAVLKGGYQDVSNGRKLSTALFGKLSEHIAILTYFSYLQSQDYVDGNGNKIANSAANTQNQFIKLNGTVGQHHYALSYDHDEDKGLRNKRTNLLPALFNPSEFQRVQRTSVNVSYDYQPADPLIQFSLAAYTNENNIKLALGKPTAQYYGSRSNGFNLSNISRFATHKFNYGYNYRYDTGYAKVTRVSLSDEHASVSGIYAQDDWTLNDSWLASIGGRYDQYRYTDGVGQHYRAHGFSPSASLSFMPTAQLTLQLSHAQALRGVGLIEPFLKQYQKNNSHIDAEKARNEEFSLQWRGHAWHISSSVFRQRIDNYIGYDQERHNQGDVLVRGYNASMGYQNASLSASLGMSFARPSLNGIPLADSNALLLGSATGRTWIAQLDYAMPQYALKLGWTGRVAEKLSYVPTAIGIKPGYTVHDIYLQWLPTGKANFNITLTIKNLFDCYYRDQASFAYHPRWGKAAGLPEPGRDIRLTLLWKI